MSEASLFCKIAFYSVCYFFSSVRRTVTSLTEADVHCLQRYCPLLQSQHFHRIKMRCWLCWSNQCLLHCVCWRHRTFPFLCPAVKVIDFSVSSWILLTVSKALIVRLSRQFFTGADGMDEIMAEIYFCISRTLPPAPSFQRIRSWFSCYLSLRKMWMNIWIWTPPMMHMIRQKINAPGITNCFLILSSCALYRICSVQRRKEFSDGRISNMFLCGITDLHLYLCFQTEKDLCRRFQNRLRSVPPAKISSGYILRSFLYLSNFAFFTPSMVFVPASCMVMDSSILRWSKTDFTPSAPPRFRP